MITKDQFRAEERKLREMRRKGYTPLGPSDRNLTSWLRGWRQPARLVK